MVHFIPKDVMKIKPFKFGNITVDIKTFFENPKFQGEKKEFSNANIYLQVIFKYFYVMVTTLTVVGYGSDMPAFNVSASDNAILIFIILIGCMIFSVFSGQLNVMFQRV